MAFHPRKLRHRIDIEERVSIIDSNGDRAEMWQAVHSNVPAEVDTLSVREYISSQHMNSQIVARITIRHRTGLNSSQRINHNGRIYNPEGWMPDKDSMLNYLTAPCSEGVNEG